MAIDTFANLSASVASWLQDSDVSLIIPDWITLTEADFNKRIRVQAMEVTDEAFVVSDRLTAFPTGFLEWRALRHNSSPYEKLDLVGADWADEHYQWINTGRPRKYMNEANQLRMVPTPDTSYTLIVTYYAALTPLSASNATNWLLTNYPDIYLYGTLSNSAGYLGSDERIDRWKGMYETQLDRLVKADQRSRYSGSTPSPRVRVAP